MSRRLSASLSGRSLLPACALAACAFGVSSVALGQPALAPPEVIERVDAVPPPESAGLKTPANVLLTVLVAADGTVGSCDVSTSAGAAFDEAACAAVKRWRFRPALRDGAPAPSRISVSFAFAPPAPAPAPEPLPSAAPERPALAPAAPPPEPPAVLPPAQPTPIPAALDVSVWGQIAPQEHGASDFHINVGALRIVPRANAADYLKLAPGILLTNEGGEGHAEQVFLRGFDAREGQDVEFSVDGVPINDGGNVHGNGYADTHFIIPELIQALRVTEGPFLPSQGNYAVAGSADYHLGLETRGTTAKVTYGSWNTQRVLLLWGPPGTSAGTFGAVDAYRTDGFGVYRAATRSSAMGQYEIPLPSGAWLRLGGQAYATHFQTTGVVRQDDWQLGRVGFFGTEDPLQGGDASRVSAYATYERPGDAYAIQQSLFLIRRDMRLREDFTGFLTDTQNELDTLHGQRGDLIDMSYGAWTLGGHGLARSSALMRGLRQSIDVGYLARVDLTDGTQYRNTVPGNIPYKLETDLQSTLTDIGLYADASLRPWRWLTLRGGARVDTFSFDVLNLCAAQGDFDDPSRSRPPTNQSCHDQIQFGAHREPVQRSSTGAVKLMPRATAIVGPLRRFTLSLSYGEGVRSVDPTYVSQDLATPFASVRAYEGGATWARGFGTVDVSARSVVFMTKVDQDLVFSQTAGRNVLAAGTTRLGWTAALRVLGRFFDEAANLTLVRPTFDDTHLQIPYVPTLVFREDAAFFHELPARVAGRPLSGTLGLGWTYVGRRALPYNQESDVISVIDATAAVAAGAWQLQVAATNLLDTRYRLGEFNYASDFRSAPEPTLIAARHFTAGAPRGIFVSLSCTFGAAS